jgi:hypothetical protein
MSVKVGTGVIGILIGVKLIQLSHNLLLPRPINDESRLI